MQQSIDHKIEHEEFERKEDNMKIYARFVASIKAVISQVVITSGFSGVSSISSSFGFYISVANSLFHTFKTFGEQLKTTT